MHCRQQDSRSFQLAALCLAALAVAGCNQPAGETESQSVNLAICDMDKVAEEMGYVADIRDKLKEGSTSLNEQLQAEKTKLEEALKEKQEEFGEEPTDEQKQELGQLISQANQRMQNLRVEANSRINQYRALLIQETQEKVKQPISEVAKERGIQIVASKHTAFVYVDDASDITDAVIAAAKKADGAGGSSDDSGSTASDDSTSE